MSPDEILPTHRVPPVVRAPNGQVGRTGFEPVTDGLKARGSIPSDLRNRFPDATS
jgi:hypothetical protein